MKQVKTILEEIAQDDKSLAGFDYHMRKHLLPKGFRKELDKLTNFIRATENGLDIVLDLAQGKKLISEFGEELNQLELEEISKIVRNKTINSQLKAKYGRRIRRHGQDFKVSTDEMEIKEGSGWDAGGEDPLWNEMK